MEGTFVHQLLQQKLWMASRFDLLVVSFSCSVERNPPGWKREAINCVVYLWHGSFWLVSSLQLPLFFFFELWKQSFYLFHLKRFVYIKTSHKERPMKTSRIFQGIANTCRPDTLQRQQAIASIALGHYCLGAPLKRSNRNVRFSSWRCPFYKIEKKMPWCPPLSPFQERSIRAQFHGAAKHKNVLSIKFLPR